MTAAQGGRSIGDIHVGINYEKLEFFSDGAAFAGFAAHCALVVLLWQMRAVRSAVDLRSAVADSNDPGTSSSQRGHHELFSSPQFFK